MGKIYCESCGKMGFDIFTSPNMITLVCKKCGKQHFCNSFESIVQKGK